MASYGKAFWTSIGVFISGFAAFAGQFGLILPPPYPAILAVVGAVIVFAAQAAFEAGLIPESKRK